MSSLTNNQVNSRSMNGLVNIQANSGTFDEIDCNTLTVALSATAPTVSALSNDTNIATTSWVTNHAGGSYVTLNTNQTITGQKKFNNFNYIINDSLVGTPNGTLLFQDPIGDGALMYYNNDNTGGLGGLRVVSTKYGFAFSSTTGAGENCSFRSENISFEAVGGTITFLGAVPQCSIVPTTGNMLCNKTYIDNNFVDKTTAQIIAGNKTFTGQVSAGSIMTNAYNPVLAADDVNINATQTSGSLNLGTKSDRSGIIQIGNGVNATCDIRIGTARTTSGAVSVGSNSSTTNTLNLQSNTINIGTGSPFATANTVNIGNGNTGSVVALKNDTTVAGTTTFNGKVIVDAYEFAIKSAGADKLTINYAIDTTSVKIKKDGDALNFTGSDDTQIMKLQDTFAPLYKKGSVNIPDSSNFSLIPAGTILTSVLATAPTGYVLCNGASYSTAATSANPYYELFQGIAYSFGGSGATFNVPNFQGAFLRGAGTQTVGGVAYTAGAVGTAQQDAVQTPLTASNQGFRDAAAGTRSCVSRTIIGTDPVDTGTGILPRFTRTATDNRPFNHAVYYYIKY